MNRRPLKKIEAELATVVKRQAKDAVEIGGLLAEAKEQLDHGEWLPWLQGKFSLSIRTAQHYMAAHAFAGKYETFRKCLITVRGLYALVDADRNGHFEAVEVALAEAKTQWVDADRVYAIGAALAQQKLDEAIKAAGTEDPPSDEEPPSDEVGGGGARDEETQPAPEPEPEPEPDDDRPPPTPPPALNPRQAAQLSKFETAAKELLGLAARSAREFLATAISDFDLETAANFLEQVAREKKKLKAADSDQGGVIQMEEAKS
ncbi:MAG: DUF3102 domain-containing protein [Roseiarcus sp.]